MEQMRADAQLIRRFLALTGYSMGRLEREIGMSQGRIHRFVNYTAKLKPEEREKIIALLDVLLKDKE